MLTEDDYTLWLVSLKYITNIKIHLLKRFFGSAKNVFEAGKKDILGVKWLTEKEIGLLSDNRTKSGLLALKENLTAKQQRFICSDNPDFPSLLSGIQNCPAGIFYRGNLPGDDFTIGVIGSRNASEYGKKAAREIAEGLAKAGVTVVSGLAAGIDGMASRAALECDGKTIAVLGSGIDICYPEENRRLYEEIPEKGCLISEYLPGTEPLKSHFPSRNRIISGLSSGIVVVEAKERSGTNITVDFAIDQGRNVFAVPGSIYSELSCGTNSLIKSGAVPVTNYEDILFEYFGSSFYERDFTETRRRKAGPKTNNAKKTNARFSENRDIPHQQVDAEFSDIYNLIRQSQISVNELVIKTSKSVQDIMYALTMLEIEGLIRSIPGGMYDVRN